MLSRTAFYAWAFKTPNSFFFEFVKEANDTACTNWTGQRFKEQEKHTRTYTSCFWFSFWLFNCEFQSKNLLHSSVNIHSAVNIIEKWISWVFPVKNLYENWFPLFQSFLRLLNEYTRSVLVRMNEIDDDNRCVNIACKWFFDASTIDLLLLLLLLSEWISFTMSYIRRLIGYRNVFYYSNILHRRDGEFKIDSFD